MKKTVNFQDQNFNNERPRVSVVVPAYNHEKYVGEAIFSVLGQRFKNFELIVINDGSADATLDKIREFEDPRIKLYTQKNSGAARTINRGIQLSRGEFISILNSDDLYHPERLARFVSLMDEQPECMIASSYIQAIDQYGKPVDPGSNQDFWSNWYDKALACFNAGKDPFASLLSHNFVVSTSNIFVRSVVFKDNRPFNDLLAYCHDYEFLLRIIGRYPFDMIKDKLLSYRLHPLNAIKENEFLKHLEVLYAIFSTIEVKELLSKQSLEDRISVPLFLSLFENPEINPEKYPFEYLKIISEKHRDIEEISERIRNLNSEVENRDSRLLQADQWLQSLKGNLEDTSGKLEDTTRKLEDTNRKLEDTTTELHSKNRMLHEIYNSKGWKWLTRYRRLKQKITGFKIISWMIKDQGNQHKEHERPAVIRAISDFMMGGAKRLVFYRSVKRKISNLKGSSSDDKAHGETAGTTQHIQIMHPIDKNRPVVIHAIANFMTGGSSRLVADLVEHIGHRYEQEVITFYAPSPPAFSGFPIHEFPRSVDKIAAFLNQKNADILHVHYWGECDDPWYRQVFAAARKHRCIVVENVNTPVETHIDDIIDHYVYVSDYARNFSSVMPEPATVIYPGSDLDMFKRNGAPVVDDVIGMVYRLEMDKLREDSIQVFIDVVKRRPGTKAVIIGGGSFLDSYERQVAEQGVTDSFEFTGWVSYKRLPEYYRRLSVFVAPVWKESFGQVSPFAMGMEIPVAGYNIGALPEILGSDECFGANREELADIIIHLLDNKEERLRIGARNRNRAVNHFSLEAMVTQYDRLYESLMRLRGRGEKGTRKE